METTVDKLEALVRKADSDLKFMSCKLEHELSNAASKDMEKQSLQSLQNLHRHIDLMTKLNPIKTIEALEETKKKYIELVKQYEELQKAQKETYETLSEEVRAVCKKLEALEDKAGVPPQSSSHIFTPLPNRHPL